MRQIFPVFVLLLLFPAAIAAQDEESTAVAGSELEPGLVELLDVEPTAGEAVQVRLRGKALDFVLENPCGWAIESDGTRLEAEFRMAEAERNGSDVQLNIIEPGKPEQQDRVVIIDRGESPVRIDILELSFSSNDVLTTVLPSAGPTRDSFSQTGTEQLVMQRVTENGVLRLADIKFKPLPVNRYIKLIIRNAASHALSEVSGRTARQQAELHEVDIALGSMRSLPLGGGSIWPLVLSNNRLPLRKLKIVTEAPGMYRRIRLVRLDDNQRELFTEAEFLFADNLQANGISRTENYMELESGMGGHQPALVIEDGTEAVLPIRSVQAYAAEVWLVFNWPQKGQPILVDTKSSVAPSGFSLGEARLVGTFHSVANSGNAAEPAQLAVSEEGNRRNSKSVLGELDLQRYLPQVSISRQVLAIAAFLLALLGFSLLLAARQRDIRA